MRHLALAAFCLLSGSAPGQVEPGRWAFNPAPDDFRADALLDLRFLNEKEAGGSGFVTVDANGDFLLGDGRPARFWSVNTTVGREKPFVVRPRGRKTEPDLAQHARFLAKRGVNMVRLHAHLNPDLKAKPSAKLADVNEQERDWIWRTVAAMKREGIYTTISPYWANTMQLSNNWGIPGGADQAAHGLLFFDEKMQEGYKAWLRALFAETNPYTGVPLAREPAVAIIQLQNEDSLVFWTVNNLKGAQRLNLGRRFAAWVQQKYGSLELAMKEWSGNTVRGDDPASGVLEFHNIWEMTQVRRGGVARRLADQLQFWTETMYRFNREMADYLLFDLGCAQLVNAGNWKSADPVRLEDAERWSYTAANVIAVNRYFSGVHNGPNRGWAIVNGDEFTSPSALLGPRDFPLNLKQVRGYPMLVTESAWVMPMAYATEGPFLVAAYLSLTGVDSFCWFSTGDDEWTPPQSANGYLPSQGKWLFGNPDMLGTFPAAALTFRLGYVRRGEPVVREERALGDLWQRRTPIIAESPSFDPNRDSGDIAPESSVKAGVDPLAFLAGPVEAVYGGDPARTAVADLAQYITDEGKTVRSVTGEIVLNTELGFCTVDTPKAQGVAAFFRNRGEFTLSDVAIRSANDYGTVMVVAMDDLPIRESGRILVQVGTQSRPTGWKEQPKQITTSEGRMLDGFEVASYGQAPWQVARAAVEITVNTGGLTRATVLDMNGNKRGEIRLERTEGGWRFRFPEDAMYVVLQ
ncbi:MAG: hypothetical protein AAB225_23160 [Acidobacteriota bacterium]